MSLVNAYKNFRDKALEKANKNLKDLYGDKHRDITLSDIEKVFTRQLLSIGQDAKTSKGTAKGYLTGVLYLAPHLISGFNTCPAASKGCSKACLFSAGRGRFYSVYRARIIKTLAFYINPLEFEKALDKSIEKLKRKAEKIGFIPVVRLNGTSDILWDRRTSLIQKHSDIQFYEYTKIYQRFKMERPTNLDLTFSLTEDNWDKALEVLSLGGRVAVVFRKDIPETFRGFKVINGDNTDLRFLDGRGLIIGLKAKGRAKTDKTGFVYDIVSQDEKIAS